jgi:hypothetical protein
MRALQAIAFVCILFIAPLAYAQKIFPVKTESQKSAEAPPPAKIDAPFDRLQGNAWALVLTGPEDDPLFREQIASLEAVAEKLKAREMVVIHFHGRTLKTYPDLSIHDYELPSMKGSKKGISTHRKIKNLEAQLHTDDDVFSVVLVGKDGETKYVWTEAVRPGAIFHMMDNPVPMTQK